MSPSKHVLLLLALVGCGPTLSPPHEGATPERAVEKQEQELTFVTGPRIHGVAVCASTDPGGNVDLPLAGVKIEIDGFGDVVSGSTGSFILPVSFGNTTAVTVRARYRASNASNGATTLVEVVDDVFATRSQERAVNGSVIPATTVSSPLPVTIGPTLEVGTVRFTGVDCELFRIARMVTLDFHAVTGDAVPGGETQIMRRAGVFGTTPYTFYDYINLPTDYLTGKPGRSARERNIFHEFGHLVRDVADGSATHWNGDNIDFMYARSHTGLEVSEEPYAFHEGWARYWAASRYDGGATLGIGSFTPTFVDWVENMVGNRLLELSSCVGAPAMVATLTSHPGTIHSLFQFESALCDGRRGGCCGLERSAPAACPPGYANDGLTCRLVNILAKPSYGRGAGSTPTSCGAGKEYDAGLCYGLCQSGYDGVGPVCWEQCPSGYHDDGAFCRRDVKIISANTDACPWYDVCGLTLAPDCSICPAGYHNDGCTCRIDAHIFAKDSYGRGAGSVPSACSGGKEYDAGLCYAPCASGYDGVGPVCWGQCPAGFDDQGATCYKAPHIIRRYPNL